MNSQQTKPVHAPAINGRRIIRLLLLIPLLIIVLAVAGVGVLFLRSDFISFRPRLPKINQVLDAQRAATPVLPPFLVRCLHAEDGAYDQFTAGCLLAQNGLDDTTSLRRMVRTYFWNWSLNWHFSEEDRDMLRCAYLSDGAGKNGIHHLSSRLYGRPIGQLTELEQASLVVASRSPTRFLKDRPRMNAVAEEILRRVKAE